LLARANSLLLHFFRTVSMLNQKGCLPFKTEVAIGQHTFDGDTRLELAKRPATKVAAATPTALV